MNRHNITPEQEAEILEGLKKIAIYMGAKESDNPVYDVEFEHGNQPIPQSRTHYELLNLEYDVDLNWLMPVCKKIHDLHKEQVVICKLNLGLYIKAIHFALATYEVNSVFLKVVEAVDIINKTKEDGKIK